MTVYIREYREISFDHRGQPTQIAKEPCLRKSSIEAGGHVVLHSKTSYFMVMTDEDVFWDVNAIGVVSAASGTFMPAKTGICLSVDPGTGMVLETAAV